METLKKQLNKSTLWSVIAIFMAANILVWHSKIDGDAWWLAVSTVFAAYVHRENNRAKI